MVSLPIAINVFKYAQTFFLDPSVVKNASEVGISKIDLFFRAKPPEINNKSGIVAPGVEVTIVPVRNGVPATEFVGAVRPTEPTEHGAKFAFYSSGSIARKEWGEIQASSDASLATSFQFSQPFFVKTNQEYAILVKFDGHEDFILWQNKKGNFLVGTQTPSPGVSGNYVGNFFEFASPTALMSTATNNSISNTSATLNTTTNSILNPTASQDPKYLSSNWTPITDVDLKFNVYVARYSFSGSPVATNTSITSNASLNTSLNVTPNLNLISVSGNVATMVAQGEAQEYILFDAKVSSVTDLRYGDAVFQNQPYWPGNRIVAGVQTPLTISVTANSINSDQVTANLTWTDAAGVTFNNSGGWNNIFTQSANDKEYIVIVSGNDFNVRGVTSIVSNTVITLDDAVTFSNTAAYFFKAPVGYIKSVSKSYAFGLEDDLLILNNTNANSTVRFVNNSILGISVTANGTGYSNSNYIVISGYEDIPGYVKGGINAYANIVTNASGNIAAVYVSNPGAGFINTAWLTGANLVVYSAPGVPSSGSGAAFSFDIGSKLYTEFSNSTSYFANTRVVNIEAMRVKPEITVNNPLGTAFTIKHRTLFYKVPYSGAQAGYTYFARANASAQEVTDSYVKIFKSHTIGNLDTHAVLPSRSNEFIILKEDDKTLPTTSLIGEDNRSNSAIFLFDISSNNDFSAPFFDPEITRSHYSKYVINSDYTDEHTNYGNAWAKHITTKVTLNRDRLAEDLLVYVTAYRPVNTDIKVFARMHNSTDPEAFDDKDWTLLEIVDGVDVYSSKDNSADFKEYTYNLTQYPNTDITLAGAASITQGNDVIVGTSGSNYHSSDVTATFNSNTGVNGTAEFITLSSTNPFANGDQVYYVTAGTNTAVTGLTNATMYYVVGANSTGVQLSSTYNGSAIDLTPSGTTTSTGHTLYRTAVVPNDLIKVYSPLFPNTYTISVVNNTINSTAIKVKRTYGDLSANLSGTVTVNTSSPNVVGTSTSFQTQFAVGDYIYVWANATFYETRKITSIASNTSIVTDSNFTVANTTGSNYGYVTPSVFSNTSVTGSGFKIDRLRYKHQVFNNQTNDNVARYYNTSMMEFDGYDSFQIKVVMLSDDEYLVPKIDDIRAISVSS